jgi:hypothetical protein
MKEHEGPKTCLTAFPTGCTNATLPACSEQHAELATSALPWPTAPPLFSLLYTLALEHWTHLDVLCDHRP